MNDFVIPIWKPVDWTSFDVVKNLRNQIKSTKVGHAGSLDPFAQGILMLCTGNKTKIIESFMDQKKEYIAKIKLGIETDTLDPTGNIHRRAEIPKMNVHLINTVLKKFIGEIMQEPPIYSALKFHGIPLYKLARQGIYVRRKKRKVKIYDIKMENFEKNNILIKVTCGRGTYIRALAKDISAKLGTVGHLISLQRTKIGNIDKKSALKIQEIPQWLSTRT